MDAVFIIRALCYTKQAVDVSVVLETFDKTLEKVTD